MASPCRADLPARHPIHLGMDCRFPGMLLSPTTLSGPGQPSDPETSPLVPARCAGDTTVPVGVALTPSGDWDSGNPAFAISRGSPGAPLSTAWTRPPVSWHAIFPVHPFGPRVSHQIPRHLLSSLPATR